MLKILICFAGAIPCFAISPPQAAKPKNLRLVRVQYCLIRFGDVNLDKETDKEITNFARSLKYQLINEETLPYIESRVKEVLRAREYGEFFSTSELRFLGDDQALVIIRFSKRPFPPPLPDPGVEILEPRRFEVSPTVA
jgi:hypothetical protein